MPSRATELGTEPIRHLLFKYSLPAIIAMTASSLYNIVDSIYIGHIADYGDLALAALTVAKPFMDICAAFGSLVGVGAGSVLAIYLGRKDYDKANKVLGNVIVMNVVLSLLVMVVGLVWLAPILRIFGASEGTLSLAYDYMQIILFGNVLTHIYFGLNNLLRSAGHPKMSMTATMVAMVVNIVLDPILIFGLDMGVRGAALATVVSQAVAVLWQLKVFCNPNDFPHFHRGIWLLDRDITLHSLSIGMSPFLTNLAHCLVVVVVNNQLKRFGGDMAIASYGIINRLVFVFAMMVMGFNQGMQPITGYNYGAKQYHRMLRSYMLTTIYASVTMAVLFVLGEFFPEWVVRMFTDKQALVSATVAPMRIVCCSMLLVGFQMVSVNLFTSIGKAGLSIVMSLSRQVLILIPLLLLLPLGFADPLQGVWWSIPISDTLSALLAVGLIWWQTGKFRRLIREQEAYLTTVPPQPD